MNPVYLDRMADKEPKQKRRRRIAILVVVAGIAVLAIVVVGWLLFRTRSQSTAGASEKVVATRGTDELRAGTKVNVKESAPSR